MQSHFVLLTLYAFFVSLVFALLAKEDVTEQLRFGGMMFAGFLGAAIVLGWLMYHEHVLGHVTRSRLKPDTTPDVTAVAEARRRGI
jgi:hypothetical protein